MKRPILLVLTLLVGLFAATATLAQGTNQLQGVAVVLDRNNDGIRDFSCNSTGSIDVRVYYTGGAAWITAYSGIMDTREVTGSGSLVYRLNYSPANSVFDGKVIRFTVWYGPAPQNNGYGGGTFWFSCEDGRILSPDIAAYDDFHRMPQGFPRQIAVHTNDSSSLPWRDATIITPPRYGTIVDQGLTFEYTPSATFTGADYFIYRICNVAGMCATAKSNLYVSDLADPFLGDVDVTQTTCNGPGNLNVSFYYAAGPAFITVESAITHVEDVTSTDSADAGNRQVDIPISSQGAVFGGRFMRIRVQYGTAPNDGTFHDQVYWFDCETGELVDPSATINDDSGEALENFTRNFDVLTNDVTILPFDLATMQIVAQPTRGTVDIQSDGTIDYTYGSNDDFSGTDSFSYEVCNVAGECGTGDVNVSITDLPPHAVTQVDLVEYTCDGPGMVDVHLIYSGGPGYVSVLSGINEVENITSDDQSIFGQSQVVPMPISSAGVAVGQFVPFTVRYGTAPNDGTYHDQTYWFDCTTGEYVNQDITANDDSATALENFPKVIEVLTNDDSDLPFDQTSLRVLTSPARGSAVANNDGTITYTYGFLTDFSGTDRFTYEACNVAGTCSEASVEVTIADLPPPTIENINLVQFACTGPGLVNVDVIYSGGAAAVTVLSGITESVDITTDDQSLYGQLMSVQVPISSDNNGVQGDGVLILDVLYGTSAGDDNFDRARVYFDCETGQPISPIVTANDDYVPDMGRNIPTDIDVLANDESRLPLDLSTLTITSAPSVGTAEVINGMIVYIGDGITLGETQLTYEVSNTEGFTDSATVYITLINLPPVCNGSSEIFVEVWPPNNKLVPIVIDGVYDPDGDTIRYELLSVTVYENGEVLHLDPREVDFDPVNGMIRAQRSGTSRTGRIYVVEYRALDPEAQFCDGTAYIYVPHDQRHHGCELPAVDEFGNPFPRLPEQCERGNNGNSGNDRNNGNNGNNGNAGNNNPNTPPPADTPVPPPADTPVPPPADTPVPPPADTPTEPPADDRSGNNNGNDKPVGNEQGDPQRGSGNNNGNGNGNNDQGSNEAPSEPTMSNDEPTAVPPTETEEPDTGGNNGRGNDKPVGNAQGDPQRNND